MMTLCNYLLSGRLPLRGLFSRDHCAALLRTSLQFVGAVLKDANRAGIMAQLRASCCDFALLRPAVNSSSQFLAELFRRAGALSRFCVSSSFSSLPDDAGMTAGDPRQNNLE